MVVALYITETPEITIANGVACIRARSHDEELCWNLPLREFRITLAKAGQCLDRHDHAGAVVPFVGGH